MEVWFRELKSHLGMADFGGQNFGAFERHVDLVMLAFASQEWRRIALLGLRLAPKIQAQMVGARTSFMKELLDVEAQEGDSRFLENCLKIRRLRDDIFLEMLPLLKVA